MFFYAGNSHPDQAPVTVYVGTGWQIAPGTNTGNMFYDARGIKGQQGTAWASGNPTGGTYARIDKANEGLPGYFWNKYAPDPPPGPTPPVNPSDGGGDSFTTINNSYNTTNNNNTASTTSTTGQGSPTDSYSNPQGAFSNKSNIVPGTSNPNWFLFILLLTLSILTLGVSLFLFYRKRKQKKGQQVV